MIESSSIPFYFSIVFQSYTIIKSFHVYSKRDIYGGQAARVQKNYDIVQYARKRN